MFSSIHTVHTASEPAHKFFTLSIKPEGLPEHLKNKALIFREVKDAKKPDAKESAWDGEFLKTRTRDLGKYYIIVDTIPPKITPVNISHEQLMSGQKSIQVKITDDLSGIKSYRGTIDGKWILMEYDEKNDLLTYFFDERCEPGERNFVLKVSDKVGNHSSYEVKFRR